jgi:hypothetical protein
MSMARHRAPLIAIFSLVACAGIRKADDELNRIADSIESPSATIPDGSSGNNLVVTGPEDIPPPMEFGPSSPVRLGLELNLLWRLGVDRCLCPSD